ncbi:hypothetical protein ES705_35537 [subsurface metagenome]
MAKRVKVPCKHCGSTLGYWVKKKGGDEVVMRIGRFEIERGEIRCRRCGTPHAVYPPANYAKIARRGEDLHTS